MMKKEDVDKLIKEGFKVHHDLRPVKYDDSDHGPAEWEFFNVVDWTNVKTPKSWFRWKKMP